MERNSQYCNTDLDIISSEDLSHLVSIFEEKCDLLSGEKIDQDAITNGGKWFFIVEAESSGIIGDETHDPNRDISELLSVLEVLDRETKQKLQSAEKFAFNIGWISSNETSQVIISTELLARISALGATMAVTIYPISFND